MQKRRKRAPSLRLRKCLKFLLLALGAAPRRYPRGPVTGEETIDPQRLFSDPLIFNMLMHIYGLKNAIALVSTVIYDTESTKAHRLYFKMMYFILQLSLCRSSFLDLLSKHSNTHTFLFIKYSAYYS